MAGRLSWERDHCTQVTSVEDLDTILYVIAEQAASERPVAVQLSMDDDTALCITVGGNVSPALFYTRRGGPLVVNACGQPLEGEDEQDEELFIFSYEGEYSEALRRECLPMAMARDAMRLYFLTDERPDNLSWEI